MASLTQANLPLVKFIVRRFLGRGKEFDDLFQTGCIGLIKAIRKFDRSMNIAFSTYAVPLIMGEIRRFLRDDNAIHISRSLHEAAAKISRIVRVYEIEHGITPDIQTACRLTGIDPDTAVMAINALQAVRSLSEPNGDDGGMELADRIAATDLTKVEDGIFLRDLLSKLDPIESQIIKLRFFEGKTQKEVGILFNRSQVQISRIEKRIFSKLRSYMDDNSTKCAIKNQSRKSYPHNTYQVR